MLSRFGATHNYMHGRLICILLSLSTFREITSSAGSTYLTIYKCQVPWIFYVMILCHVYTVLFHASASFTGHDCGAVIRRSLVMTARPKDLSCLLSDRTKRSHLQCYILAITVLPANRRRVRDRATIYNASRKNTGGLPDHQAHFDLHISRYELSKLFRMP